MSTDAELSDARLVICGGHTFNDPRMLSAALSLFRDCYGIAEIIHGAASGADLLAGAWAKWAGIPCTAVPAQPDLYGDSAGPRRNAKMLGMGPTAVLAFPGGPGTAHMCKQANSAGVPVLYAADILRMTAQNMQAAQST